MYRQEKQKSKPFIRRYSIFKISNRKEFFESMIYIKNIFKQLLLRGLVNLPILIQNIYFKYTKKWKSSNRLEDDVCKHIANKILTSTTYKKLHKSIGKRKATIKRSKIYAIRLSKGKETVIRAKEIFKEIMAKIFPNLVKEKKKKQLSKYQFMNLASSNKVLPTHIEIKLLKTMNKEQILKVVRDKWHITYRRIMIQMTRGFLSRTMDMRT